MMGQKYAAYDAQGDIVAFYDDVDSPVPAGLIDVITITDVQWEACLVTSGHKVINGALVAPIPPNEEEVLAIAQTVQAATLSAACQAAIYAGFTSSALGTAHTYPAKNTDQQNLSASVLASLLPGLPAGWITPFWCEDSSGTWAFVPHTTAQIQQVGTDGKTAIMSAMAKNATLAAQVMAATSVAAVQAITWS